MYLNIMSRGSLSGKNCVLLCPYTASSAQVTSSRYKFATTQSQSGLHNG